MQTVTTTARITTESSLKGFFHDELERACEHRNLSANDSTICYLTNLLHQYSRSERFFDFNRDGGTLTPLAEYYRNAVEACSDHERRLHLQRLGDVAIFITGVFAAALGRRVVGVKYYMAMGENAYGSLAESGGSSSRDKALADIFSELASHFPEYVSLLGEVGHHTQNEQQSQIQRLLEEWNQPADSELAEKITRNGIIMASSNMALEH